MSEKDVISVIIDKDLFPRQDRLEAITQLGVIRSQKKEQLIRERVERRAANHLSIDDVLPGQSVLRQVIQDSTDQIDVRCHAAAMVAKTDNQSALDWCTELIEQYV